MKKYLFLIKILCGLAILFWMAGCRSGSTDAGGDDTTETVTPVTVTTISQQPMTDYFELNAVSAYLLKSIVKSNVVGYLSADNIQPGQFVQRGQRLFTVTTKEASALGNTVDVLDSSFRFSGKNVIRANSSGYITQIDHQNGDYVQDGEQLAVITDKNSFVFLLDMPYELRPFIINRKNLELILPDGEKLNGRFDHAMPVMDSATQTQRVVIRVSPPHSIPENLIARVRIVRSNKPSAETLPKDAVLTDETQTTFWVMKMIDSTKAIKVPIKRGMESDGMVEILSPVFNPGDKILLTGNYGLPDTARVRVENQ